MTRFLQSASQTDLIREKEVDAVLHAAITADHFVEVVRIAREALDLVKFANCQTDDRERALIQMKANELRAQLAKLAGENNG